MPTREVRTMGAETLVLERLITAEDLAAMPDDGRFVELVEGRVIELPPAGFDHCDVAGTVVRILGNEAERTRAGRVTTPDCGYVLSRDPDTVRCPDAAFVSIERLPGGRGPKGYFEGAPDLAVEVVSPSQTTSEMRAKAQDYLEAGARLVWVIYPERHAVHVFRPDSPERVVRLGEALSGEDVLSELSIPVGTLFA